MMYGSPLLCEPVTRLGRDRLSKRLSRRQPARGVVVYEYVLLNQRDETVFTCRSTNLVKRRQASP